MCKYTTSRKKRQESNTFDGTSIDFPFDPEVDRSMSTEEVSRFTERFEGGRRSLDPDLHRRFWITQRHGDTKAITLERGVNLDAREDYQMYKEHFWGKPHESKND